MQQPAGQRQSFSLRCMRRCGSALLSLTLEMLQNVFVAQSRCPRSGAYMEHRSPRVNGYTRSTSFPSIAATLPLWRCTAMGPCGDGLCCSAQALARNLSACLVWHINMHIINMQPPLAHGGASDGKCGAGGFGAVW